MASPKHLQIIQTGVAAWNKWRSENPEIEPDLSKAEGLPQNLEGVDFSRTNLRGADLKQRDLKDANLKDSRLDGVFLIGAIAPGAKLNRATGTRPNLRNADLTKANLTGAVLPEARLGKANLTGARLNEADLSRAELKGATLVDTDFRDASLANTDLTDETTVPGKRTEILGIRLGGTDVTKADLPKAIADFEMLQVTAELSRNARKVFVSMLLGCIYTWLTVSTTADARLLTNSASSPLPIIQAQIPIVGFYIAAPIVLLALYIYFHLYLQRLWDGLATLPAIFRDGKSLNERAYPWLLNGMVSAHFKRLEKPRLPLWWWQYIISVVLAWCVVPGTLLLFWWRYLPRHNYPGTMFHLVLIAIATFVGTGHYLLCRRTLRGITLPSGWRYVWRRLVSVAVALVVGGTFSFLTYLAIGQRTPSVTADFEGVDVSTKPANWTGTREEEIDQVRGAKLRAADLRGLRGSGAFLAKADLSDAHLLGADLRRADFSGADLRRADFSGANLIEADLRGAQFADLIRTPVSLTFANVYGVLGPYGGLYGGFEDWAINEMGAVSIESDEEWEAAKYMGR